MYFFVRKVVSILLHAVSKATVIGVENVPPEGPFLLTPNHLSQIDTPFVLAAIPRRMGVFAARKYRKNPFLRVLFETMGCIWVRQFEADREALRQAIHFLKNGGALGVAPEGTRSRETHALLPGRGGAALLASRSGVPVLPVAIWGTEMFVSDLLHLRRGSVFMRIGQPHRLEVNPRAKAAELDTATDDLMCAIAALLPPRYRGVYADHPRLKAWLDRAER
ncbi:MAG: 1-acyl-sn-glycerol-3-phosphate acyltransferase [Anaerolineales bacterium]|nr:1-acyl-sn-glycerol-3-phosphate acyltransferase [Anaerolineales bacterium]